MLFDQITFVIQGPITPSITSTSVRRLRSIFPGCQIIVSTCFFYTSEAAAELLFVVIGGRSILKKKKILHM